MSIEAAERVEADTRPRRIVTELESTRRSLRRFDLPMVLTAVILGSIAWCVVIAVADVSWVLPFTLRAIALAGLVLSSLGYLAFFFRARRPGLVPSEMADRIEEAYPELGQRVRTTLEYLEPNEGTMTASPSLVRALFEDTDRRSRSLSFSVVVPWSNLNRRLLGIVVAGGLVVAGVASDPNLAIAAARVFLAPLHYTKLTVEPGDRTVKVGEDFHLKATLAGRPVRSVRWFRRPVGGSQGWSETALGEPSKMVIGTVEASQADCQADFEYRVDAGEIESDVYRVHVTHPLVLKSFQAAISPPAYTRLKPSVAKQGDFKAPEGSKVHLTLNLDRAPASARISWTPRGSKTPTIIPLNVVGSQLSADLPVIENDVAYQVSASAPDGMVLEPLRCKIKAIADAKPTIKFLKPAETTAATATTEIPIEVRTSDDYGVAKLGISYRVDDGPEETLLLDQPGDQPPSVETLATLYLEKHRLTISNSLSYQAFVEDNRTPEPQRVTSEIRFIDILPYKQDYQLVDGGAPSNGKSVTLEDLILRQRQTLNRTAAHLDDRPVDGSVADRIAKDEAELTLETEQFAAKLAARFGPINPLDDATRAMQAAAVTLGSKDFPGSMPHEQSALASLIKARQNLRKLMSTASTAGQTQKIDREEREQKIRRPPASPSKEAELAKLEQDIRKLAENQKKFADAVDPVPKAGPGDESAGSKPPAQSQQAAVKEAERLNELAKQDKALSELARERMAKASQTIQRSEADAKAEKPRETAEAARSAAGQLERLAEQVEALKARDLAGRIALARDLARSTAKAEHELAELGTQADKAGAARKQAELAEKAKTLADVLEKTQADATEEDRTLAANLEKAVQTNSPSELEAAMKQASTEIESGQAEKSGKSMKEVESRLDGLARDLETARRDFTQPKLQQLLAVEKQAAEVKKALESVSSEAKKAEAEKAMADLAGAVEGLKSDDPKLQQASEALTKAVQPSGANAWNSTRPNALQPGLIAPPVTYANAIGQVSRALQGKIQEMILNDALIDRDGPVPPGYKEKVEDYFRLLSEDIR